MSEADFVCAICGLKRKVDPWDKDPDFPPICKVCERVAGYDWAGHARYRTKPSGGTFRDRRNATRIIALADEIAQAAKRIEWSSRYGRA